jgi:hypothetical protein
MLSFTYNPLTLSVTYKPLMLSVTNKPLMLTVVMLTVFLLSVVAASNKAKVYPSEARVRVHILQILDLAETYFSVVRNTLV